MRILAYHVDFAVTVVVRVMVEVSVEVLYLLASCSKMWHYWYNILTHRVVTPKLVGSITFRLSTATLVVGISFRSSAATLVASTSFRFSPATATSVASVSFRVFVTLVVFPVIVTIRNDNEDAVLVALLLLSSSRVELGLELVEVLLAELTVEVEVVEFVDMLEYSISVEIEKAPAEAVRLCVGPKSRTTSWVY